jgi:hypothetical protein
MWSFSIAESLFSTARDQQEVSDDSIASLYVLGISVVAKGLARLALCLVLRMLVASIAELMSFGAL